MSVELNHNFNAENSHEVHAEAPVDHPPNEVEANVERIAETARAGLNMEAVVPSASHSSAEVTAMVETRTYQSPAPQPGYLMTAVNYLFSPITSTLHVSESFCNNRAIMTGALKKWDERRLKEGKLAQLHAIGSQEVLLITPSGDKIHGVYLGVTEFNRSITELGGSRTQINIIRPQAFLHNTRPIKVTTAESPEGFAAVQVNNPLDTNITELVNLCEKNSCTAVWPDKSPVNPNDYPTKNRLTSWLVSWVYTNPHAGQPIYIIPNTEMIDFRTNETTIVPDSAFSGKLRLFSPHPIQIKGVLFDKADPEKVRHLLSELKIYSTSWDLLKINNHYFLTKGDDAALINIVLRRFEAADCELQQHPLPPIDTDQSGVVLATMNQTNSFSQYTHEILMFLLEGANVFFYDNCGKGLSEGQNSQYRMIEAIETPFEFLSKELHFPDIKILIKGQCSGGVIASVAAGNHPESPVWIDQAPNSFQDMVGHLFVDYMEDGLHIRDKHDIASSSIRAAGITLDYLGGPWLISKLLPNIDVTQQLRRNHGLQIYTVGVTNNRGEGGDALVPLDHVRAISAEVQRNGGEFVPIRGGTHVTDWWKDPVAYSRHIQLLERAGIIYPGARLNK